MLTLGRRTQGLPGEVRAALGCEDGVHAGRTRAGCAGALLQCCCRHQPRKEAPYA